MFHRTASRHRRVITPEGVEIDDTVRFPRLAAAAAIVRRRDEDVTEALPAYRPNTGPDDVAGVSRMPFTVQPLARSMPGRPSLARDFVRLGFQMVDRQMDQFVAVLSTGWRKLAAENDRRMTALDARLARLVERQHTWAAAEDGRLLDEAYAEGGTELVQALTPEVLARMDERAKTGSAAV
jgi:hypothetical protein